jgi:tRNA pseudouridine55 synthase
MDNSITDGEVLLIDKPLTWTSFDVVKKVRGIKKVKKVGHAGTLDPLATGLLVVCTGKLTKTIQGIQDAEKEYTGTFCIGATTASFDLESEVEQQCSYNHITSEQVMRVVKELTGDLMQVPPMHSAVKLNGVRSYELARRGEVAELKARAITIREFEITRMELPELDFRIVCTKGTYIRSLARDLGLGLNVGAYLKVLRRTRIGNLSVDNAVTLEELAAQSRIVNEGGL